MAKSKKPQETITCLAPFATGGYRTTKPIEVCVEPITEDVNPMLLAESDELMIRAAGASPAEAIEDFKRELVKLYKHYKTYEDCLGTGEKRRLAVLEGYIQKEERNNKGGKHDKIRRR